MRSLILCISFCIGIITCCKSQDMVVAAKRFIGTLDSNKKSETLFPFDIDERYNFHFIPKNDRKGISMNEMNDQQKQAALTLIKSCLSEDAVKKVTDIMALDLVLKALEHRKPEDHYRDPGNYHISVFGIPGNNTIWGWRLEGHHISFNFSANENKLVSGTPGFLGSNPALVLEGPQKGKQVLKDETAMGFALLNSLSKEQLKKAIIDTNAPKDILTFNNRNAMLEHPSGIRYREMTGIQQQQFLQLINVYVHRYTKLFADDMLKEIHRAGLNSLWFTWAGATENTIGKGHYYRIQGPTIIIEYDNTQNNANHIHTVVRDLQHDFGGDLLLEHYRIGH